MKRHCSGFVSCDLTCECCHRRLVPVYEGEALSRSQQLIEMMLNWNKEVQYVCFIRWTTEMIFGQMVFRLHTQNLWWDRAPSALLSIQMGSFHLPSSHGSPNIWGVTCDTSLILNKLVSQIIMFQHICSQRQSQRNIVDHFILDILGEVEFDLLMLMLPAFNDALICVSRTRMWWDNAMTSSVSEWVRTTVTTSCWVSW